MKRNTINLITLAAVFTVAGSIHATPDRDWPSVVPAPIVDVPMRDTAITRGLAGTYYLTGTLGVKKKSGVRSQESEGSDFENSRVIKLWKSKDLKKWDEIGVVWDLDKPAGDYDKHNWMTRQAHKDPSRADSPVCWGITAPELHFIKGDWYICFSMNDQGTGLLKSTSGKPEGPYEPHAQITLRYGDPSLFWDRKDEFGGDNSVYFLFGGGWIAKLNNDLTALAERPRLLQPQPQTQADWTKRTRLDFPLQVGDHGVFLFKNRGRYYLTAAERTNRMNASCDDTFVASAASVSGPYDQRSLMVPHGGGITVFQGPRSSAVPSYYYPQQKHFLSAVSPNALPKAEVEKGKNDDTLYATFFGNDDRAIFQSRPAFVPLEWTGPERYEQGFFLEKESLPRKPLGVITERGPWPWMRPLLPNEVVRDIKVCPAPDGNYYFSGSTISHPGKLPIWRSKDLAHWEMVPSVWSYEQIEWLPEQIPYPKDVYPADPNAHKIDWKHIFWQTYVTWWKDTFYITFAIFDNDNQPGRGVTALKSTSGKIEGPYVSLGKVGGQLGPDPGPVWDDYMFVHKGVLHSSDWKGWRDHVAIADLDLPGWKWNWKKVDHNNYDIMQRGDCCSVDSIEDIPIFCFRSSGRLDMKECQIFTYDVNYVAMETPWGPVVKDAKSRNIPHVAMSNLFKDHQGRWWSSLFGTDSTAPWREKFGLVPLRVEKRGDHEIFIDVEDHPSEEIKRIMGGGEIAEVKTVLETIGNKQ